MKLVLRSTGNAEFSAARWILCRVSGVGRTVTVVLIVALAAGVAGHGVSAQIIGETSGQTSGARNGAPLNLIPVNPPRNSSSIETPEQLNRPSPKKQPSQIAAVATRPLIKTRYGRHKGYRRIVFEWTRAVEYRLDQKNGFATVRFSRPGRYSLAKFADNLRRAGIKIREVPGQENLVIRIEFPAKSRLRHYRSGGVFVIDIVERSRPPAAHPEPDDPKQPNTRRATPAAKTGANKMAAPAEHRPGPAVSENQATAPEPKASTGDEAQQTEAPKPSKDGGTLRPNMPAPDLAADNTVSPTRSPTPQPSGAQPPGAQPSGAQPPGAQPSRAVKSRPAPPVGRERAQERSAAPVVSAKRTGDAMTLRIAWPDPVRLAVFRRGRHIWLVFSALSAPDLEAVRGELGGAYYAIERIEHETSTVLRLTAARSLNPSVKLDGGTWILEIGPRARRPKNAITVEAQPGAAKGPQIMLKAGTGGSVVTVVDPEVGDSLFVVPVATPGFGVGLEREFAEFRLLTTIQGVVVEPYSDSVRVRSVMDGVVVASDHGLRITQEKKRRRARKRDNAAARIFDFSALIKSGEGASQAAFIGDRQRLQLAIVNASDADRNIRRLALARFYFGHGQAADTLGVLASIADHDEELIAEPSVRALRGASRLLTNNLDGAADDLLHQSLDDEPEIALWRGALASTQRNWRAAVAHFGRARGLLNYYPRRFKIRFALLAAEAELASGAVDRARGYLNVLAAAKPLRSDLYEMRYLQGRVLEQIGEPDAAIEQWRRVAATATGTGRIKSEVARIDLLRARGKLDDIDKAIGALDRLRFAWRGDALEYSVLHLLGQLYLDKGDYKRGFGTLLSARRLYPGLARDRQLLADMQDGFTRLFVDGAADEMPPVKALALFQGFRELVPRGPRGNRIIEKLADRLVAVDLLGHASKLLADQIARRLRGQEKARVGARLALLYLLDQNPGEALNALEATNRSGMASPLIAERRRLQARAFAALGENDKAMSILAGDTDRDANLLRADIYWRQQNWPDAARVLTILARNVETPQVGKFSESDSRLVLRLAVALALASDGSGLKVLRRRFDAAMDTGPYADTYLVVATEIETATSLDYATIAAKINEVDRFQAFMANYREKLQTSGLSAIN